MDLTPIFRKEFFLDAIIKGTTPPEPIFREEFFLAKIAGADVETPTPIFRIEKYLAKIGGDDVEIPDPVFREEYWLAKKCGENVTTPTPVFRLEYFLEEWVNGSAPAYQSVTGKIVSFLTQRAAPLKIEATLSPIQDLHGQDAPYPPGGGKQMLPDEFPANKINGRITDSGYIDTSSTRKTFSIPCKTNTSYTISQATRAGWVIGLAENPAAIGNTITRSGAMTSRDTLTINSGNNTWIVVDAPTEAVFYDADHTYKFMIEEGSTASPWQPYSNICPISGHTGAEVYVEDEYDVQATPTVTITFGQTVYGGTLVVNEDGTGSLLAQQAFVEFDGSEDEDWRDVTYANADRYTIVLSPSPYLPSGSNSYADNLLASWLKNSTTESSNNYRSCNIITNNRLNCYINSADGLSTVALLKTYLSSHPLQVCYELATPVTIPLTPGQVEALQGNNTVWVDDSGEIKVTYRSN